MNTTFLPAYVPLEELRKMRQEVLREVTTLEKGNGDPTIPKAVVVLADAYEKLYNLMHGTDNKMNDVKNNVQLVANEREAAMAYMREAVVQQSDALFRLVQQTEILEAHALDVSLCIVSRRYRI